MISVGTETESQPRNVDAICGPEKAFDTANHELLYALLVRYGALDSLIDIICQLHDDIKLNLKIGDEERNIPYTTGIKQGDCMAPVLFLFLMQAFAETLENKWKEDWQLQTMQYTYHEDPKKGQLQAQTYRTKGSILKITHLLYVNVSCSIAEKTS